MRIETIGFHDSFESPDDGWIAEGWIRTDNRLPNNTWLQVAQGTHDGIEVSRSLISGSGDLSVDILPGVSQVLVAVSPVVPQTSLPTEYKLEMNLLNAAGEIMAVSRECTVTTTHVLNYRDAPKWRQDWAGAQSRRLGRLRSPGRLVQSGTRGPARLDPR